MKIPYGRQTIDERDIDAVTAVLRGDWLTQGPAVAEFERRCAEAAEVPYAVAYSSGTAGLHAAAFAAGVGPGDELMTSALTFAASANCGVYQGATPTFADIDPDTWNVSGATMNAALTERTRAVVPVDFAGLVAPLAEIREAVGDDVVIIEDAAHSLGARTADGAAGNCAHADMAVFSFHPVKPITSGEGGVVTTRDPELRQRLVEFRTHGMTKDPERLRRKDQGGWYMEQQALGFNYRLTDLHSALGVAQLERLGEFIDRRNAVAARYRDELADVDGLRLPPAAAEGDTHGYHLFVVWCEGGADVRRRLYDGLHERGVLAQVHYVPVYWHPWYVDTYGYAEGLCPEAESYYSGCLSLPCFPTLTEEQQDHVVTSIKEVLAA